MTKPEIPEFGALLGPILADVPAAALPGFLARLERTAADRYRAWAEQSPQLAEGLLACAAREDEIAARVEKLFPLEAAHQDLVDAALPKARDIYYAAFDGYTLEEQLVLQAHAERQGSLAWLGLAEGVADEGVREALGAIASLELESADHIDATLGSRST